ncbi:UDP-glucose dehydrogenase [Geosporobacter subterraneus DSM 17957]|uniref:UDP-glucose 6-dehydrogenase n=2 Tax=Geosporobacter TaxID=390805 RepID=A0A1M6I618_9FIRM|nr:UDP-glucose dehydrogenase [Geosporobacter subterraneus DSM 17957]
MMKVIVVGTGYVGLVTGTCLAEIGHRVICIDKDEMKIEKLKRGISPIYEAHLEDMICRNIKEQRLSFSTDMKEVAEDTQVIFIAVGTPSLEDGDVDLSQVEEVAREIGKSLVSYGVIVNKSTVPVGSCVRVAQIIRQNLRKDISFDVVSNPEFLREGTAVYDTFHGDRIVIGSRSKKAVEVLRELYKPFHQKFFITNPESAELIKYASNAFLATKISFINEMANLCEKTGGDIRAVAEGMGMDQRIGNKFLQAGVGFGGACFPKDVKGLLKTGEKYGYDFKIIRQTLAVNEGQKQKPLRILEENIADWKGIKVGILGLAFKPGTDDVREAPALQIIKDLRGKGAQIRVYDPVANASMQSVLQFPITYCNNPYDAVTDCDAVILLTEWPEFQELNLRKIRRLMKRTIFIDGRNVFASEAMGEKGFDYYPMGIGSEETAQRKLKEGVVKVNESEKSNYTSGRTWNQVSTCN